MEAVTVAEVIVALKPLWTLAQGPAVYVCFVVFHQSFLKQNNGSFVVSFVVQPHCCCEGVLQREETAYNERNYSKSIYEQ